MRMMVMMEGTYCSRNAKDDGYYLSVHFDLLIIIRVNFLLIIFDL